MSSGADCHFFLANDGKWYLELEDMAAREYYVDYDDEDEWGNWSDSYDPEYDYYGPFHDLETAQQYLSSNFVNPGGFSIDSSGQSPPPRLS